MQRFSGAWYAIFAKLPDNVPVTREMATETERAAAGARGHWPQWRGAAAFVYKPRHIANSDEEVSGGPTA
jgi:hypothetical protein